MRTITKDIIAAFSALTRLPLWRIKEVPKEHYERIVYYWPVVGVLTGAVTAGVIWGFSQFLPIYSAVTLGFIARLLLTGGLHEDGLMDFFDGFGGGRSKERVLEIMKDSHTGAYGVMAFVSYAILWISLLASMPIMAAVATVMLVDPMSKMSTSTLPKWLPYVRREQESKMGLIYVKKPSVGTETIAALFGILYPLLICQLVFGLSFFVWIGIMVTATITKWLLILYMKRRIGGYTGDCLGATLLITEVICYIVVWILI